MTSKQPAPEIASAEAQDLNRESARLWALGKREEAIAALRRVIRLAPAWPAPYFNLGFMALQAGKADEARQALLRSVDFEPNEAQSWLHLGLAETALGNQQQACEHFTRASVIWPGRSEPLLELARVCIRLGDMETAILHYRHALLLQPQSPVMLTELGSLYHELGMHEVARDTLLQATRQAPDYAPAQLSLAATLYSLQDYRAALEHLQACERINPDEAALHNNFGMVYNALADSAKALQHFQRALELNPRHASAHSNLLLHMHYQADITPADILAEAQRFGQRHTPQALPPRPARNPRHDRLRIGYVSPDLRMHAVGLFIEPVLQHHDRGRFEVFAYADVHTPDARTRRIQQTVEHWRNCNGMTDAALAQQIRQDRIDILVDLAGHTANNRLTMFAHGLAPLQITWLGHPGTTGLGNMDYLVTDDIINPPGAASYLTEQPLRLPHGIFCYRPELDWTADIDAGALPALRNGHITFASFNNLAKVNDTCLELWRQILDAVPGSRLLIKGKPFTDARLVQEWRARLGGLGLNNSRVDLRPYDTLAAHMRSYREVDIHLDSFPYHGATTTCDALWMGVPVVTLLGEYRPARIGASLLHQIDADSWAAETPRQYVDIAVALASDLGALAQTRADLRERVKSSPLYDPAGFTRALESALLSAWAGQA